MINEAMEALKDSEDTLPIVGPEEFFQGKQAPPTRQRALVKPDPIPVPAPALAPAKPATIMKPLEPDARPTACLPRLRHMLFLELQALQDGTSEPDRAHAVAKIASQVVNSIVAETNYLREFPGPRP